MSPITSEDSEVIDDPDPVSDPELIARLRAGDIEGSEGLWRRHHRSALAFATSIAGPALAPDLVSEGFERVFAAIRSGGGPDVALRPYLLTAIRRRHIDHIRRDSRSISVDDFEGLEGDWVESGSEDQLLEASIMQRAFQSLPQRAQTVLWYGAVEGATHVEIGRILGLRPNAVAALAFRAREALRQAYVTTYLGSSPKPGCAEACDIIPRLLRDQASPTERARVESHLTGCEDCRAAMSDLGQLRRNVAGVVFAAAVGVSAPRFLESYRAGVPADKVASAGRRLAGLTGAAALVAAAVLLAVRLLVSPVAPPAETSERIAAPDPTPRPAPVADPPRSASPKPARERAAAASRPSRAQTSPAQAPADAPTDQPAVPQASQPTPTASATSQPTQAQTRLGQLTSSPIEGAGQPWFHLLLPVSGADSDTRLEVRIAGATQWTVHRDQEFGAWLCQDHGGSEVTLTCALTSAAPRSLDFALDLLVPESASVSVRATPAVAGHSTASLEI